MIGPWPWPNFNIADSLLVCGAAMLRLARDEGLRAPAPSPTTIGQAPRRPTRPPSRRQRHPPQPGVLSPRQLRDRRPPAPGRRGGPLPATACRASRSAIRSGGRPCCRVPNRSPGPRSRKSISASSKAVGRWPQTPSAAACDSSVCGVGEDAAEAGKLAAADPPAQLVQLGQAEAMRRSRSSSAWRWARPRPPRPPTCRPAPGFRRGGSGPSRRLFPRRVMRPWISPRRKASNSPLASDS